MQVVSQIAQPVMAEALGLRWPIQSTLAQGIFSVSIISDAVYVVNCITKKMVASIDPLAQDCRDIMLGFSKYLFIFIFLTQFKVLLMFIRREHNFEAHNLACLANRTWLWTTSVLFFIGFVSAHV
jgi:hypothetical protein